MIMKALPHLAVFITSIYVILVCGMAIVTAPTPEGTFIATLLTLSGFIALVASGLGLIDEIE